MQRLHEWKAVKGKDGSLTDKLKGGMLEWANKLCNIIDAATEAETRKRTTYMRIGQQPKVEYKRSLSD